MFFVGYVTYIGTFKVQLMLLWLGDAVNVFWRNEGKETFH